MKTLEERIILLHGKARTSKDEEIIKRFSAPDFQEKVAEFTADDLHQLRHILWSALFFPPLGTNHEQKKVSDIEGNLCDICSLPFETITVTSFDAFDERGRMALCQGCFAFDLTAQEIIYEASINRSNFRNKLHFIEFLKLLDTVKSNRAALEKTRLFLFDDIPLPAGIMSGPGDDFPDWNGLLDLPFESCAFECADIGKSAISLNTMTKMAAFCVIVSELSPDRYQFLFLVYSFETNDGGAIVIEDGTPIIEERPDSPALRGMIKFFLERMAESKIGTEKTKERVRIGKGKERRIHKIREIIRVISKTNVKKSVPLYSKTIDWSHRWEVRGHWRETAGVGKNRYGEYCVKGFTWVNPFLKGPDDKAFIAKKRIFIGEEKKAPVERFLPGPEGTSNGKK